MEATTTIVAVASPPGWSTRGMVRLSGPHAREIVALADAGAGVHRIVLGGATLPTSGHDRDGSRAADQPAPLQIADELPAIAIVCRAPRSFTGEDTVELLLPGNPHLLSRVVAWCLSRGAHAAQGGEFSARAWLNGKRSLDESEGIAAAIAATTDAHLRAARRLQRGDAGREVEHARDALAALLALVEAGIDFTDQEDVIAIGGSALATRLGAVRDELCAVEARPRQDASRAAPWVVLAGATNAGKSSLFNALVGRERAVEASVAGTTRDLLPEPIPVGTTEVMLVDTPGEEPAVTTLDQAMQEQRAAAVARASLVLRCVSVDDRPAPLAPREMLVRTKGDRPHQCSDGVVTSARTREGLEALRALIAHAIADSAASEEAEVSALLPRHANAVARALDAIDEVIARTRDQGDGLKDAELIAAVLRSALNDLGSIAGHIAPDDVIGLVFASFCVGK